MKQPRNITVSRVFVGVMIVLALFFANIVSQMLWAIAHEIMRGVFTPRIGFPYRLQFVVPVLLAVLVAVVYTVFAQSPIGVSITKSLLGVRPVMTDNEKSLLEPIHDEVFESIREKFPNAIKRQLYIFDSADINAFCMNAGSDIAIHRGSTQTFNDEELKALIAHEYGHSHYKDGLFSTLFVGAQYGFMFLYIWPFIHNFRAFRDIIGSDNVFMWAFHILILLVILGFYLFLFKVFTFPIRMIVNIILGLFGTDIQGLTERLLEYGRLFALQNVAFMMMSKQQEYRADEFASYIGYKYGMLSVLELFHEMEYQPVFGVLNKVFAEHPATYKRIANVEKFEVEDY